MELNVKETIGLKMDDVRLILKEVFGHDYQVTFNGSGGMSNDFVTLSRQGKREVLVPQETKTRHRTEV